MITFYFSLRGTGGVQVLIINLTKELLRIGQKVKIFHYKDDFIYRELEEVMDKIVFHDLDFIGHSQIRNYLTIDDCLIITMLDKVFFKDLDIKSKLLFWNVCPSTCFELNVYRGINFRFLNKRLLKYLLANGGITFMDDGFQKEPENEFYDLQSYANYLPIPVLNVSLRTSISNKVKHITYVGRAVDWKIYPFLKVIDDLKNLKNLYPFKITIITDNIKTFQSYIKEYDLGNIDFLENLSTLELNNYLVNNSDLHFGMGTAALDAAKNGIPTVIVDASHTFLPEYYTYRWIFESVNFNLGYNFVDGDACVGEHRLESIMKIISNDASNKDYSIKCFTYIKENHNIDIIAKNFLEKVSSSKATIHGFNVRNIRYYLPFYGSK